MLSRMFDKRCVGYEAVGYTILLPTSALPGWPPEVPLPIDPQWKKNYAASVRRLIRDGVDVTLGNLFVNMTRAPGPGTEGIERARSASEAFLFRRLETLPETKGCFQLNAELHIPFDERSKMRYRFRTKVVRNHFPYHGDAGSGPGGGICLIGDFSPAVYHDGGSRDGFARFRKARCGYHQVCV